MVTIDEQFLSTVQRLAAPADEQEAYVRQLGTAPSTDELALEFSDALLVARGSLSEAVASAALRLDAYLAKISGSANTELWTILALYKAPEWMSVRQLAGEVLQRIMEQTNPAQ